MMKIMKYGVNYDKLQNHGIPKRGSFLDYTQVLITASLDKWFCGRINKIDLLGAIWLDLKKRLSKLKSKYACA